MRLRYGWWVLLSGAMVIVGAAFVVITLAGKAEPSADPEVLEGDDSNEVPARSIAASRESQPAAPRARLGVADVESHAAERAVKPPPELTETGWLVELPMSELSDAPTEEVREAVKEAIINGLKADSLEEAAKYYEEYLAKYPLSPDAASMMNRLALTYARIGRYDEGRNMLRGAIALCGEDRFVNTLEINLAYVDIMTDDLDAAEDRLRRIMARPVPKSLGDPYTIVPQYFGAPLLLTEVYQAKGRFKDADELVKDVIERGLAMEAKNPGIEWLTSFVAHAYGRRVGLVLQNREGTIEATAQAAYQVVDELKKRLPEYRATHNMIMSIRLWEQVERKWER